MKTEGKLVVIRGNKKGKGEWPVLDNVVWG